ncbi:MAG: OmpA family protein [Ignavibacteria bacterium]|nr:OmpA family protein [Ignavibacteria bacterium]
MSDSHPEQPIIIKKRKKHAAHPHHGGAWKVAYADFVTAIMAFFLVMWIVGLSQSSKKSMAQYFKDPGVFSFKTGKALPIDLKMVKARYDGTKGENSRDNYTESGVTTMIVESKVPDSVAKQINVESKQDSSRIKQLERNLSDQLKNLAEGSPSLKNLLSSLKVELTNEGLRIEMVESKDNVFFEVGSAKLTNVALDVLKKIASEIGKIPNYVEIEGHTDSRPFGNGRGYSNWELSGDRANSARRVLELSGLWEGQVVSVAGYADRKLRTTENPFDVSNRRVSILVKFQHPKNA